MGMVNWICCPTEPTLPPGGSSAGTNFNRRANLPGFDTTCPPSSVYAAYNALTVPKSIHTDVLSGHTSTPAASKFMQEAAAAHLEAMK